MQERTTTGNKMELINVVNNKFNNYPHKNLNNIFLTLQTVTQSIILNYGGNDFEIQHIGKEQLERQGLLPRSILAGEVVFEIKNHHVEIE